MSIFHHFTGCISHLSLIIHYIEKRIYFYLFKSSHRDIFYKITVLNCAHRVELCLWKCPVRIKVAGYRPATLLKLNFFTSIFHRFWSYNQLDTLQNSYFDEILISDFPYSYKYLFISIFISIYIFYEIISIFAQHFLQWLLLFIH